MKNIALLSRSNAYLLYSFGHTNLVINNTLKLVVFLIDKFQSIKLNSRAGCPWLTPVILATQKAEIRRIAVQSQHRQIVHEILSRK
jgi:hypothetical protein